MSTSPLEDIKQLVLRLSVSERVALYQHLVSLPKGASERGVLPIPRSEKTQGLVELRTQWDCVTENGEVVYSLEGREVFRASFSPDTYVEVCFDKLKDDALVFTLTESARTDFRKQISDSFTAEFSYAPPEELLDRLEADVMRDYTEHVLRISLQDLASAISANLQTAVAAILGKVTSALGFSVANDLRERLNTPEQKFTAADAMKVVYASEWQHIRSLLGISSRGGSDPRVELNDQQCEKLSREYRKLLKHWRKVSKNSKTEKNWRAYAQIDEPDTPNDLLDRLDGSVEPQPSNEDYPTIPSVIALEHAARRCGIPNNEYSSSRLKHFRQRGDAILANPIQPIEKSKDV